MTTPLSLDLRKRLIAAVEGGQSCRSAAKRFGVAAATAIRWVDRWRREGQMAPRPLGGDRHSHRMEAFAAEILGLVAEKPDTTLAEIAAWLEETHGVRVAGSTVWRLLDRHGMTFKKNGARKRARAA